MRRLGENERGSKEGEACPVVEGKISFYGVPFSLSASLLLFLSSPNLVLLLYTLLLNDLLALLYAYLHGTGSIYHFSAFVFI